MSKYLFTFEPVYAKRLELKAENAELFYAVLARTYKTAVSKILKMGLPLIDSEEDLFLTSVQEENDVGEDEEKTAA